MDLEQHAPSLQYLGVGLMTAGLASFISNHPQTAGIAIIFYGLGGLVVEQITGKKLADTEA